MIAILWTLAYSDGEHSLLDIAGVSELSFSAVEEAAATLSRARLLDPV